MKVETNAKKHPLSVDGLPLNDLGRDFPFRVGVGLQPLWIVHPLHHIRHSAALHHTRMPAAPQPIKTEDIGIAEGDQRMVCRRSWCDKQTREPKSVI